MTWFDGAWPWIGLVPAALLLSLLFGTSLFRTSGTSGAPGRWHDLEWLAVLSAPVYMLHQLEEHGVDLFGATYAFRGSLCGDLGYPDPAHCPIPFSFITAVNVATVWGAILLAAVAGRRQPLLALTAYGVPFVNAIAHIVGALRGHAYNPGLLTAVVLFVPLGLWALHIGRCRGIAWSGIASVILGGIATHVVLMGSLLAYVRGSIDVVALDAVQILNATVPIVTVLVVQRVAGRKVAMSTEIPVRSTADHESSRWR